MKIPPAVRSFAAGFLFAIAIYDLIHHEYWAGVVFLIIALQQLVLELLPE